MDADWVKAMNLSVECQSDVLADCFQMLAGVCFHSWRDIRKEIKLTYSGDLSLELNVLLRLMLDFLQHLPSIAVCYNRR